MRNPWPGNFEGLVSLPRLHRTGPPISANSPIAPIQITYAPFAFFANTVWSLIANVNGGTGSYSGDTLSVACIGAIDSYSRAIGTLTYTSAIPRPSEAIVNVVAAAPSGLNAGFIIFVDGVQTVAVNVSSGGAPILPIGTSIISIGTLPAGSHTVEIKGKTDIAQPSRLFIYSGGGSAGSYSVQFRLV